MWKIKASAILKLIEKIIEEIDRFKTYTNNLKAEGERSKKLTEENKDLQRRLKFVCQFVH